MAEPVVAFDDRTAEKLLQSVRQTPGEPPKPTPTHFHLREVDVAKVTAEITARSGASAGSGTAESVYRESPSNQFNQFSYTVVNWYASTIAVDQYIVIARVMTGDWVVVGADCS